MSLEEYKRKRDFAATPEPAGAEAAAERGTPHAPPTGTYRFVVQRHRATRLHYDFRLEMDGVLASWAIPKGPTLDPKIRRGAFHVEDHPVEYFDFEGTIPKGQYGGGDVIVWDWGTYEPEMETPDPGRAIAKGELKFVLQGEKLHGRFTIVRTRGERDEWGRSSEREEWLLIKKRDDAAAEGWNAEDYPQSVKTGRTNDEVKANAPAIWLSGAPAAEAEIDLSAARPAPLPDFIEPMKATLTDRAFDDPGWLFELKWDGYRVQAHVAEGEVALYTRRGRNAAEYFPELARPAAWLTAQQAILDGEVVALNERGEPEFGLLQERLGPGGARRRGHGGTERPATLVYEVFDLLYLDGRSLLDVPLEERKRLLRSILRDDAASTIRYATHIERDGTAFFRAVADRGLEGVVAKLRRSRYEPGRRSPAWLKIKRRGEQEAVIGGWTPREGSENDLGALILGVYEGETLRPAGKVGTGYDTRERARLLKLMEPLRRATSPIHPVPNEKGARWVEPRLVARIEFSEWTQDGLLRQSSYKGLELDKDPKTVTREVPLPVDEERNAAEATAAATVAEREEPRRRNVEGASEMKTAAKAEGSRISGGREGDERKAGTAARGRKTGEPSTSSSSRAGGDSTAAAAAAAVAAAKGEGREGAPSDAPTAEELAALDELPAAGGLWGVAGHQLKLTNLDKVLWPADGITKRDLIRYYASVAPVILPYLRDRGLTVYRRPNGIDHPGFWQKEIPGHAPKWIPTWNSEGWSRDEPHEYIIAERAATLAWLGNEAAIDLHPWTSRVDAPERPTWALIDVDPGEKTTWDEVVELTRLYRAALEHLGVRGFPKVTGQRGIQVWVPIKPIYGFDQTRDWVMGVSRAVAGVVPQLVSWEWEKSRRRGLARLDYTQNALNKTLVAPYAVRPAPGAPVSAPITWDELEDPDLRPNRWTIRNLFDRLAERGDLFAPALGLEQELPPL